MLSCLLPIILMLGAAWISWHLGKAMSTGSILDKSIANISNQNDVETNGQYPNETQSLKEKCQQLLLVNNERMSEINRLKTELEQNSVSASHNNSLENAHSNQSAKNEIEYAHTQKSISPAEPTVREIEVIKEVPIEIIKEIEVIREVPVETIKEVEVIREIPFETIKEVEVIREVERRVEVPVEIFKEIIRIVEVPVEVHKEIEVIKVVEKKVNVPLEIIKEVQVSNIRKERALTAKLDEAKNLLTTLKLKEEEYIEKLAAEKKLCRKLKYEIRKMEGAFEDLNQQFSDQLKTIDKNKKLLIERSKSLDESQKTIQNYEVIISNLKKEAKSNTNLTKPISATKTDKQSKDDLKIVEGIGPAIEKLLYENSINTFKNLASTKVKTLRKILNNAGNEYAMHDPTTWPEQSKLAAKGNIEKLSKLQKKLKGGKR